MAKYKVNFTFELDSAQSAEQVRNFWFDQLHYAVDYRLPAELSVEEVAPPGFKLGTIVSGVTSDHHGWVRNRYGWRSVDTGEKSTLTDVEIQEGIDNGLRTVLFPGVE